MPWVESHSVRQGIELAVNEIRLSQTFVGQSNSYSQGGGSLSESCDFFVGSAATQGNIKQCWGGGVDCNRIADVMSRVGCKVSNLVPMPRNEFNPRFWDNSIRWRSSGIYKPSGHNGSAVVQDRLKYIVREFNRYACSQGFVLCVNLRFDSPESPVRGCYAKRPNDRKQSGDNYVCLFPAGSGLLDDNRYLFMGIVWLLCLPLLGLGFYRVLGGDRRSGWFLVCGGVLLDGLAVSTGLIGCLPWDWRRCLHDSQEHSQCEYLHGDKLYHKNYLTFYTLCNTVSLMANVLNAEKQTAIIAALAEGSSIRSIERITGVHRDTIMRLGVKVGKGCQMLMDSKMQDLDCHYLQFDELWGFIGKKERHVSVDDNPELGDVWTFCAIDSETKLVPSFKVGKRTHATTTEFVQDVASRMRNRVQVSSDAMHLYAEAMELAFGADVDYGQIVKVYVHNSAHHPERQYSAPHFASAVRRPITGNPEMELVSTSHVERLNATTRLHMRRLTRLTLAFSKKLENFEAAVGLHFAYYNFVKRHNTLRCTPAMAAGIERDFWSVGDLVEATA
jgi:IS1 family transposase